MKIQRSKAGFTLVEIMIVVVIIGLLAAMAIPAFQKVRRQSYAKALANDARQVGNAWQRILMDAPPSAFPNPTVDIIYVSATGAISAGVVDPATNVDYFAQQVSHIGKGYQISAAYNVTAAGTVTSFTMSHPRVAPIEVAGPGSVINNATAAGQPVAFDAEGKPL